MSNISILIDDDSKSVRSGTLSASKSKGKSKIEEVSTEKLQSSLKTLCHEMGTILKDAKQVGGFQLKEVTLQVQVSAEGSFILIGKAGVKGAITLKFSPE